MSFRHRDSTNIITTLIDTNRTMRRVAAEASEAVITAEGTSADTVSAALAQQVREQSKTQQQLLHPTSSGLQEDSISSKRLSLAKAEVAAAEEEDGCSSSSCC